MNVLLIAAATLTLTPGQQATLTVSQGNVVATAPAAATLNAHERESATKLAAEGCNADNCGTNAKMLTKADTVAERERAAANTIRVTYDLLDGGSTLSFDNGFDQVLTYRARITAAGKTAPTDVCQVLPKLGGFEHWPYKIERIEISAMRLDAWDGSPARCE